MQLNLAPTVGSKGRTTLQLEFAAIATDARTGIRGGGWGWCGCRLGGDWCRRWRTTTTDSRGYLGRLCRQIGHGSLQLETAVVESEHLQRRWLARYQWNLRRGISFSTSGSRTELEGEVQDKLEAQLEVHF